LFEASHSVFPSIVVIPTNAPKTEESLQGVEYVDIAHVLNDAKFRYDLKTDLDRRASPDPDGEVSFSIDESNHPFRTEFHRDCQLLFELDARRIVSEDPSLPRFPADCPIPDHCY
jgi:hypothetical protein